MHRLRCVACVAFVAYRSLLMGCVAFVACVTPHTNRVSLMHSVVCTVYVERYVQTIHIPFDTPASEVFSRPSTQISKFLNTCV